MFESSPPRTRWSSCFAGFSAIARFLMGRTAATRPARRISDSIVGATIRSVPQGRRNGKHRGLHAVPRQGVRPAGHGVERVLDGAARLLERGLVGIARNMDFIAA